MVTIFYADGKNTWRQVISDSIAPVLGLLGLRDCVSVQF